MQRLEAEAVSVSGPKRAESDSSNGPQIRERGLKEAPPFLCHLNGASFVFKVVKLLRGKKLRN